jgi:hypothetical protein
MKSRVGLKSVPIDYTAYYPKTNLKVGITFGGRSRAKEEKLGWLWTMQRQ